MNNIDEVIDQLKELRYSINPKNVLLIGTTDFAIIDFFNKNDVSTLAFEPDHFENIPLEPAFEIIIIDRSVINLDSSQISGLLNRIGNGPACIVINLFPEDLTTDLYQIGQISTLLTERKYFRDLENYSLFSPCVVFQKQLDAGKTIAKYEESLFLLRLENQRKTEMLVESEEYEALQFTEYSKEVINQASLLKVETLTKLNLETVKRSQELRLKNEELKQKNDQLEFMIQAFWSSRTGKIIQTAGSIRRWLIQPGSRRDRILLNIFTGSGFKRILANTKPARPEPARHDRAGTVGQPQWKVLQIPPIEPVSSVKAHQESVSIVVCVHNAFEDVKLCLGSVRTSTSKPYEIVIVDDGSGKETAEFLKSFSETYSTKFIRNETARGYTCAANQGIQASSGEFVVLLNSDTIVSEGWIDRMVTCAQLSERTGVVGPLSNTASYQSIPEYVGSDDWAENPLPGNISIQDMARMVTENSTRIFPEMPLLNGFCLLIRRKLFDEIGLFDEENFGAGYGEEDDFNLRARAAGWILRLADDTYIFHAQSKSYSNEKRTQLSNRAGKILRDKHGLDPIQKSVSFMEHNRILEGIRARSRVLYERELIIRKGRQKFLWKRVLFVLPIARPGGGGNVVLYEANAMRKMGVAVSIFNLNEYRDSFLQSYPNLSIPTIFGEIEDLAVIAATFDAVVATANYSVPWFEEIPLTIINSLGYYIQGFEPLMYEPNTPGYQQAIDSYTLIPRMKCFTKTEWTQRMVSENTGRLCQVVGVSVDIDLMHPRQIKTPEWPQRPIRIAAMIRPDSPYREPEKTMQLLKLAVNTFRGNVEAVLFGTVQDDPKFQNLTHDFDWSLCGILTQNQTANLLNDIDIFIDYSSHQAMGLTALEAMANGCAVIVPVEGGAVSFAEDHVNSLVVDTRSFDDVWKALRELIEDHELRKKIQHNALFSACNYHPEKSAIKILEVLFPDPA